MEESAAYGVNVYDVLIVAGVIGIGIYYVLMKRKNDFDTASIKTFAIESNVGRSSSISEVGFVSKMKTTGKNVIVFYGSQTGTAEEFATRLAKESNRYGLKALVADPEECDMEELPKLSEIPNSFAIFCMATYGEGDPTDNAQEFYEWLQNSAGDLTGLSYAVFGLGNKTYEHYNSMGKYVDKRLAELGATRLFELGLGDDDANIEEDFITWKERLWSSICEQFNLVLSGEDISLRQYQLLVHDLFENPDLKVFSGEIARLGSYINQKPPFDAKNPFLSVVSVNRELYKGSRSCMHIELDIRGSKLRYEAGDHVAVYPKNDTALVEKIGELLNVDLDTVITLNNLDEDSSKRHPFPCPCSYRTALLYYVDILHTPRTHVLKELAEYATDEGEKQKLKLMSSSTDEGKTFYSDYIIKNCRSIVHVLEEFPSLKVPLDHLLELLPRLQARYYSISSSPKLYPDSIHITAVLVEYTTPAGYVNKGVATSWLKNKQPNMNGIKPEVPIFVRRSQFKLPAKSHIPIIMIGPGTGLAPFRGFIQERDWLRQQGKSVGETILYYGCRKQAEDFLYEEELKGYLANGALTKLYVAFSRDQPQKVYVTHLLKQNLDELWDIIENKKGHIYICGDARNMARDVRDILIKMIEDKGNKSKSEAEMYLKSLETQRRYSADVWS
ncbi:NADPH-cytochrome P450 reductase-like protein [Dinothrombium tinctorium]|uniref:NADPH--cytochrome P450 reductase n=1 Tax=Dinothrombium tinctorium TaxID=1965070 RepID=A0A443QJ16_9ACAR|nr:NADPH-cytochrome P450 reductase-like protein [Dinothrombium tinctorium]